MSAKRRLTQRVIPQFGVQRGWNTGQRCQRLPDVLTKTLPYFGQILIQFN
jgi:hypothetical protein